MSRLRLILLFIAMSTLSCSDMGTEVNWSEWHPVKYGNISFSTPPRATWAIPNGFQSVGEGCVDADGDHFLFWLSYGHGVQKLYYDYQRCLSSELRTTIDGQAVLLAHFTCDPIGNDGPQLGMSVFIPDVGDGENQFLMLILHYDPSKEYIADLIAKTIHIE